MTRITHDRTRDHRGTESTEWITLSEPIGGFTTLDSLLIQLAANREQQGSIEDTSGATLGQLETQVNAILAVLRAAGIIGGAPRVYAAAAGTGTAVNPATRVSVAAGLASGAGAALDVVVAQAATGQGAGLDPFVDLGVSGESAAGAGTAIDATVTT